ncbi:hypothetical protein HII31_06606 [Pseudocercospora fuligena]|uniref:SGNH hydrolase-type esterase domain-containing protein n=1 Tax=Pseudocercospora fuligena TaxID=685502 RepID=A0A8H6RKY9_9PEZI|nr:hypothetical protein HII31_06606 [Pseudocercospora fuligena]
MVWLGAASSLAVVAVAALVQHGYGAEQVTVASQALRVRDDPLKIMFVGDSITHGHEGDYTWRFRVWEWLRANDISFDFVGPYTGTIAPLEFEPPQPPRAIEDGDPKIDVDSYPRVTWGYNEAVPLDFDADHFATSGDRADRVHKLIQSRIEEYDPDMLLILLGTNDLAWGGLPPDELLGYYDLLLQNARKAKPNIKIAYGNVPGRTFVRLGLANNILVVNNMLAKSCKRWSTPESPVHYVDVASEYTCGLDSCTAAFDGLHPNELGAYQIARAFSKTLIENFSLGEIPIQVPDSVPERDLPAPTNLVATSSPMGIKVTWDRHFGLTEGKIRQRCDGEQDWRVAFARTNRWDTILPEAGIRCEYQVKSCYGNSCGDFTQDVVSAVSDRDTPPPPTNIKTTPTKLGFRVAWSPPETHWNISSYAIKYTNINKGLILAVGSRQLSAKQEGMPSGEFSIVGDVLLVQMSSWTGEGYGGVYTEAQAVKPGNSKRPSPPGHISARRVNSTALSVKWSSSNGAAAYSINIGEKKSSAPVLGTEYTLAVPENTTSNLEICVSALNGILESRPTCTRRVTLDSYWKDYTPALLNLSTTYLFFLVLTSYILSRGLLRNYYQAFRIRLR